MKTSEICYDTAQRLDRTGRLRVGSTTAQCETRPLIAILWMMIAFIVGTFVFEVAATGAEPTDDLLENTPLTIQLGDALYDDEKSMALATSPLESLYRIDRNEKLKPAIDHIIETETMWLAMRESMLGIELASHDFPSNGGQEMDPLVAAIPVTIGNQEYVAPMLDLQVGVLADTQDSESIDQVATSVNSNAVASAIKDVAHAVPTHPELIEPAELDASPVSVSQLDMPVASVRELDVANATIIRAQPIALVQVATEPVPSDLASNEPDTTTLQPASVETASSAVVQPNTLQANSQPESATEFSAHALTVGDTPQTHLAAVDVVGVEQNAIAAVSPPVTVSAPEIVQQPVIVPVIMPQFQPSALAIESPKQADPAAEEPIRQPAERIAASWPFNQAAAPNQNQPAVQLNVDNADVRTIFEMLARSYGMNILVAPDVTGTVTANVDGLTPDQALHGVMKMCDLRAQVEGNVIYVYSAEKMPTDATQLRMFPLDFARAEVLEPIVQGLLSPIGNAYASAIDDKDNMKNREAIVVVDTPESIARIESYIHQADQAPRQVMIEARVLEVELKDDMMCGVDLRAIVRGDLTVGSDFLADPISSTTNPLFYAQISGSRVDSLIDLVETTTDAKTLASPRVMVTNGQQAKIQVGQQLGFAVATVTQTSTIQDVQFLDTGVVLSVKPTISRNNQILMEIKPEVSNGQINPDTLLPEEETRELETSVLLNDHQGIVIGGLIQESDRTVIRKLPCLGDVKYIGKLFQRRETTRARSEIIIALVAHIVDIDAQEPQFCDHEQDLIQYQRTQTPLFQGTLQRTCRPWEPRLPDVIGAEKHMDVKQLNRKIP